MTKKKNTIVTTFTPPSLNHAYITVAKGKRVIRFPSKESKDFKKALATIAAQFGIKKLPKDVPVEMMVTFMVPDKRKHDIDNMLKMLFDGLNGVAYDDDSQIVLLSASKQYRQGYPGMIIEINEATL